MTDIVERLRRDGVSEWRDIGLQHEAADLIERLRRRIDTLEGMLGEMNVDPPATLDEPDTDAEVIIKMREIARRALEPKP